MSASILELASQGSHGLFLIYMCLLRTCDIPSSPSASSAVLKGTVDHKFPRKNNSFSALVWHCSLRASLWGRAKIWMWFLPFSALFQVDQALTPACLMQISFVYAKSRWASASLRERWLSCVTRRHDAYQFGAHRKFLLIKREKFIHWFEAPHL